MLTYQNVLNAIFEAVDEFNLLHQTDQLLEKSANTALFNRPGYTRKGVLDSLGLINFLVVLEETFKRKLPGFYLNIAGLLESKHDTLKNIDTLAKAIVEMPEKTNPDE
ncbi:MAG: hypothetical protein PHR81_01440 [Bacteroidales bacterium]|jgi:acyl carrier protein|nr:hypothetical protein [Bacteroidales bacterium]MDD4213452.1 hypothetical protein [Bacteroidales bacterium]